MPTHRRFITGILFSLLILSSSVEHVFAEQTISVTPSLAEIDLATDHPETLLYYKNTLSVPIELSFKAQDFSELEDSGKLQLLEPKDAKNYQYSLSSWISFDKQTLTLAPQEQGTLLVSIDAKKLTKGGHYAAILAEVIQEKTGKQVAVKAILSSLLFVRAHTGNERDEARIDTLAVSQNVLSFPKTAFLRVQNTGNTDLTPHGLLEIHDPLGNLVAKGILNEGSLKTLPESIRSYDMALTKLSPSFLPGKYIVTMQMKYGQKPYTLTKTIAFYSIGSSLWYVAIGALVLGIICLFKLSRKRRHHS